MSPEIPLEWIKQRAIFREEWIKAGCPCSFYQWLLDKIDAEIQSQCPKQEKERETSFERIKNIP